MPIACGRALGFSAWCTRATRVVAMFPAATAVIIVNSRVQQDTPTPCDLPSSTYFRLGYMIRFLHLHILIKLEFNLCERLESRNQWRSPESHCLPTPPASSVRYYPSKSFTHRCIHRKLWHGPNRPQSHGTNAPSPRATVKQRKRYSNI